MEWNGVWMERALFAQLL